MTIRKYDDQDRLHRINGPAEITYFVDTWYYHGEIHRYYGPAVCDSWNVEVYYIFGDIIK